MEASPKQPKMTGGGDSLFCNQPYCLITPSVTQHKEMMMFALSVY